MKIKFIANVKEIFFGYVFVPGQTVTIGREFGNTIAPINVDGLSRHHAKIYFKDGAWYVEDLGSTNGTFRNRQKIEGPTKIELGDEFRFGVLEVSGFEFEPCEIPQPSPAPVAAVEPPPVAAVTSAPAPVQPAPSPEVRPELAVQKVPVTPLAPVTPLEPVAPLEPVTPLEPVSPMKTAALPRPTVPRRPTLPGAAKPTLRAGLKLPPKPGLGAGLKLPPKPGLGSGLKLPPKPELAAGLKLPPHRPGVAKA